MGYHGLGSYGPEEALVAGFCEEYNELTLCSTKCGEFLEKLKNSYRLVIDIASCRYLGRLCKL